MKGILSALMILICLRANCYARQPGAIPVSSHASELIKGKNIEGFVDVTGKLSYQQVSQLSSFYTLKSQVPNFGINHATFWIRFQVLNNTEDQRLLLRIPYPLLDQVTAFYEKDSSEVYAEKLGDRIPLNQREFKHQSFIFNIPVKPQQTKTIYLKIKSKEQILVPIYVGTDENIMNDTRRDDSIFGMYIGAILVMLFYNLFVYYSVKDKSYLYYVFYIFCIGFAQFCLQGFGYRLLWNKYPFITDQSVYWSGALSGISVLLFLRDYLHTREKTPAFDKILLGFVFVDIVSVILALFRIYDIGYILIDVVAFIGSIAIWIVGLLLSIRGFRPARFFIVAWSFFLLSIVIYVIKDFGVIPYNIFTSNILLIGSAIEVTLLSFALADKINIYKKEKEISQARALQVSIEQEQFVKEQNVILETKVKERTEALQQSNESLNEAVTNLKAAQSQLVEAEKMASLGQLTAGIAHEINNPINFVKSNVKPLQLDINDIRELIRKYEEITPANLNEKLLEINHFKDQIDLDYIHTEIDSLIRGIEDGASRTAEIVKGLRTFSRLDESTLKEADIHDCLDATLILIRNTIPENIRIVRKYGELSRIECYPGKVNQVFMNIITNAIQAIKSMPSREDASITISTFPGENQLNISIADTGPGMTDEVKASIFNPFFTTKEVGEGTGLGLSIVFSIIEKHHGKIIVHSECGKGTEFIITLPIKQH